ncbi:hypothetical protein OIU78_030104 [Salix suchowensis]|nr:hypothetical protein OIU78_030104 [Salix suchowensis]
MNVMLFIREGFFLMDLTSERSFTRSYNLQK